MRLSPSIIIYTLIIIKLQKNYCQNIDKFNLAALTELPSQYQNLDGLTQNSIQQAKNESIFNANYAKIPAELADPTFGLVNYDKKEMNISRQNDLNWLSTLERMRSINLEAEKYANVFSKAFAAGYSAARFETLKQQQQQTNNVNQIASANTDTRQEKNRSVVKANNLNNSALSNGYDIRDALVKKNMQIKKKKNASKPSGNLPFNITSDAVGYGAAYASGYALAAADRIVRLDKYNYSEVQPWKMNNAAAAGYTAYYAGAIAKSRGARQPAVVEIMPQQENDNKETVGKDQEGERIRIDADLADTDKEARNVKICEPAEDTIQNLIVNIDENPQEKGKGTISNIASPNKTNRSLDGNQDNEDVVTNLIIKDVNVKSNIVDKNNEDLTLDIDPSALDKKRSLFDEEANIGVNGAEHLKNYTRYQKRHDQGSNVLEHRRQVSEETDSALDKKRSLFDEEANIGVNGAEHLKNYTRYQKRHDQGSNVLEHRRQVSEETDSALVGTDEEKLIRPLVLPLQHHKKRKRSGGCVQHRYRRGKKKKMNAVINYCSL